MEFEKVFTVQKELTQDDFLRALLIELTSYDYTPFDISGATFEKVSESVKEVILCIAHVECDYTAAIGFDRKEEYWDKEKKIKDGMTYYEDVKKTRTVTDWQAHSGHISGNSVGYAFNEEPARKGYDEHKRISDILPTVKDESAEEKGDAKVSNGGMKTVSQNCALIVAEDIRYPGDRVKDESLDYKVEVKQIRCLKMPYYEVNFKYNEKEYHASGFACGKPNVKSELPVDNVDVNEKAKKAVKPIKMGMIGLIVAMFVFVVAASICMGASSAVGTVFSILVPICGITALVLWFKKGKVYIKKIDEIKQKNRAIKLDNLKSVIAKMGYAELTREESEQVGKKTILDDK